MRPAAGRCVLRRADEGPSAHEKEKSLVMGTQVWSIVISMFSRAMQSVISFMAAPSYTVYDTASYQGSGSGSIIFVLASASMFISNTE